MTDSMQFGPEWLRNLSQHDDENTMVMPKYQLAEHRYGREEMLALFDKSVVAPEPLRSVAGLYVEKLQLPLALIQMSEEETRVWNSNINNDNNPRGLIKNTPGQMANMGQPSSGMGMSRGRGISVDRGRGRSSRGPYHYNTRNYAEEGSDTSHSGTAFGRPRMFERSQSHNSERNWSERNGNADYSDWNGYSNNAENGLSTSPRKDFGSSMRLTSSREDTNWRRRPTSKDEDDGWRSSRHGRTGYSWREGGERDREKEKDNDSQEISKDRRWMSRISNMHSHGNRRNSESKDDNLPEWATESPSEGGGTFDSSGAFHRGAHSDDDDLAEKSKKSRNDLNKSEKKRKDDPGETDGREKISRSGNKPPPNEEKKSKVKEKSPPLPEATSLRKVQKPEAPHQQQHMDNTNPYPPSPSPSKKKIPPIPLVSQQQSQHQHHMQEVPSSISEEYYGRPSDSSNVHSVIKETVTMEHASRTSSQHSHPQQQQLHHPLQPHQPHQPLQQQQHEQYLQPKVDYMSANSTNSLTGAFDSGFNFSSVDTPIIPMNPTMVQNLGNSGSQATALKNKLLISPSDIVNNSISLMSQKDSIEKSKSMAAMNALGGLNAFNNIRAKGKDEELDHIVGDVVSKFMADEEKEKFKKLEGMNKWYYRDPQGQVQGPFPNTEMAEWYKLGYFHDKSLIVRRACESSYYPLHDLVTFLNGSPFETVTLQNFNKYSRVTLPGIQLNPIPNTMQPPPVPTNVPDESPLLLPQPQHYQSPSPYDLLFAARQQQILAAKKRQLSQTQEGLKSLIEQQKMMSQHMNNPLDTSSGAASGPGPASSQPTIPIIPGYMHPMIPPTLPPSTDPNIVIVLQQHQQQQLHQHLLQQQLQQQHQQQHPQMQQPPPPKEVKPDRLQQPPQPGLISHLDTPLQQLVHKMNNLSASNQIPLVQAQSGPLHSLLPNMSGEQIPPEGPSAVGNDKTQSTNAIQNLLKQLGVSTEKQMKPVDSIWGTGNVPPVPVLSSNTFNAQHWCSQVGKIGPSNAVTNTTGLWTQDGVPPTATMKTEQEIIESFMKSMQPQQEDSKKETENTIQAARLKKEEELRFQQEVKRKEEEKKAKREEEKRKKKQQEDEEKLRRIEEEQRRKAVEDAKRKEEERKRKEEEKRKREEEREQKRKADEEKKRRNDEQQHVQDLKDLHRKQAEAMKRLKEQQAAAAANKPSLKSVTSPTAEIDQQPQVIPKVQKPSSLGTFSAGKQLSKSQSGQIMADFTTAKGTAVKETSLDQQLSNQQAASNKQITKSKSTSSVPTPNQKTADGEKKVQEKKKKEKGIANAWADQKKVPQVKSLAEIQAEEQKKLAKQIEKEKQERILQQQQAVANAQTVKETTNFNIWKSQSQPWKNSWTSVVSPASSSLSVSNNSSSSMVTTTSATNRQPNTANTTNMTSTATAASGGNKNPVASNTNTSSNKKIPGAKGGETLTSGNSGSANAKNKTKKEDVTQKKSSTSSAPMTQAIIVKNDELSKWGVKALSSMKTSVDVPTLITFLREVESPDDVMEYVTDYLGDGKEIKNFVKQFLEKRSGVVSTTTEAANDSTMTSAGNAKKSKSKKVTTAEENTSSANKSKGGSCSKEKEPVSKTNSAEFVEVKAKSKKCAKKKVQRVDPALLGFNVTAAPDRINIGDRDYGEDVY